MTEDELAQIEARATKCQGVRRPTIGGAVWNFDNAKAMYATAQDILALIAEVRRLRAFVSKVTECRGSGSWYCPAEEAEDVLESQ